MSWAEDVVLRTGAAFHELADPHRAAPMVAYMKHHFAFLGIPAPPRREAQRSAWRELSQPSPTDLTVAAQLLWRQPEREFHYAACDLLAKHNKICESNFLVASVEPLLTSNSWWDSVDGLQSAIVGPLLRRWPELKTVVRGWIGSENIWLVRSAITHQLGFRNHTDTALLFELCSRRETDSEFFIAKAIGWALRDYSYTNAALVVGFVDSHPELQALSRREAMKAINRRKLTG